MLARTALLSFIAAASVAVQAGYALSILNLPYGESIAIPAIPSTGTQNEDKRKETHLRTHFQSEIDIQRLTASYHAAYNGNDKDNNTAINRINSINLKRSYSHGNGNGYSYICNADQIGYAVDKDLDAGIQHLDSLPLTPRPSNGAGKCGRVSCSYNSAIWWCNLNSRPLTLDSWAEIVDATQFLKTKCVQLDPGGDGPLVAGEVRNERLGYVVVVRANHC